MAVRKQKVTYQDGRTEVVKVLPRAQVMAEQYLGGFKQENGLTATFYLAWASLNSQQKTTLDYETWLNQIEDVEDLPEEAADPTQPAPSADDSSASVPAPESPSL